MVVLYLLIACVPCADVSRAQHKLNFYASGGFTTLTAPDVVADIYNTGYTGRVGLGVALTDYLDVVLSAPYHRMGWSDQTIEYAQRADNEQGFEVIKAVIKVAISLC